LRDTLPPPSVDMFVVSVYVFCLKLGVSVLFSSILIVTAAFVELDAPDHPANV
jgi:hypothetical protein